MKTKPLFIVVIAAITFGCERELPQPSLPVAIVQPSGLDTSAQLSTGSLPAYTATKYQSLLAAQTDEADLVEKSRLLAYALTRYLGERAGALGITDAGDLENVLPCDQGWPGDAGILRTLGTATGTSDAEVKADLSAILASRIEGLDLPQGERDRLIDGLLASLVHQGHAYRTRNFYPAANPASASAFFVSYGLVYRTEGFRALGYRWDIGDHTLTYAELEITQAYAEGMLLLDLVEDDPAPGVERFNDPCHNGPVYGGGGGNGSGNGSSNLDDDGSQKGYLNEPLITGNSVCANWSGPVFGLRVVEFHISDRNEGGLFAGKSEVFASITAYSASNPVGTYKTNENGPTFSFQGYQYRRGIQLDEVPVSTVSGTSQTIRTANGRNWILIGDGICPSGGFDSFVITFFEKDPTSGRKVFDGFVDLPSIYYGDFHWLEMTQLNDIWYSNYNSPAITLDALNQNGGFIYLIETANGYSTSTTMPSAQRSWFKIELF